jgi:hypothetical protein
MHDLSTASVAVIGTVAGAIIGFAGTAFAGWQQGRQARRVAREKAIDDTISAADDLLDAIQLYRASGGAFFQYSGLGIGMRLAVTGVQMTLVPKENWAELTRRQKLFLTGADMAMAIAPGGVASEALDQTASRFLAIVQPHRQRLSTAIAPLRRGEPGALAEAAEQLAKAASDLADRASASARGFRSAERSFKKASRAFRAVARGPR